MAKPDTTNTILDAAEKLFAREGYHGTSIRAITREAGVNLAAINYHFGSKEALLSEVFRRRLDPLNSLRIQKLTAIKEKAKKQGKPPRVRDTLTAFIAPVFEHMAAPGGHPDAHRAGGDFHSIMEISLAGADSTVRRVFFDIMRPVVGMFAQVLSLSFPQWSKNETAWRVNFVIGAFSHTVRMILLEGDCCPLPPVIKKKSDIDALSGAMISFLEAGLKKG